MKTRNIFTAFALIAFCVIGAHAQSRGTTSGPQLIRDSDHPARQPFFKMVTTLGDSFETVPAGKVLVIEFVNGKVVTPPSAPGELHLMTRVYGFPEASNFFAPSFYREYNGVNKTFFTHPAKLYIPAGKSLHLYWEGDAGPYMVAVSVSGYYVDAQ